MPAFHKQYYEAMAAMFARCTERSIDNINSGISSGNGATSINMESEFLSLGLDIIGLGVFNYDFASITTESPVIKAVYGVLKEAEHRSTFYIPYWNIPITRYIVPRQVKFNADLVVINECLDQLIRGARETRQEEDFEALQNRDYSQVKDPSLLRFLVDMRGEDATNKQLRDDLMTMLIAGHETTAAVLTWALFELAQKPGYLAKVRAELDEVLGTPASGGPRVPGYEEVRRLTRTRLCVAESLRLYPEPPLLIRRALDKVELPQGGAAAVVTLPKGSDVFISLYNIHRSPALWGPTAGEFNPDRFLTSNPAVEAVPGWAGLEAYSPLTPESPGSAPLYPTETSSDFAFLPFGGGARKCIGDQFAVLESTVVLARLLQRYDFKLAGGAEEVGMQTGATIHTANGLKMRVSRRAGW